MGKRQDAALLTRQNIINAMRILLEEKSADCISIEDITTKAGVAKGSFYTYFRRKEDVISVIAFEQYDIIKETILQSTDGVCGQISHYLKASAEIIEKNTLQIAQNWMKSVTAPLPSETSGVKKYNYDKENINTILQKAVEKKEMVSEAPIAELTECIMNIYYGAVASWCITQGSVKLAENINHFCDLTLKDILKKFLTESN
ncbi:MAG: TetR/AcrR family transcriptional regulator [Lachnospiraceae bacterium]|nr:TetR/AcrR family transcriptional regulator [Lachnospiraceae bacterium]